jgi:hypothetical protein
MISIPQQLTAILLSMKRGNGVDSITKFLKVNTILELNTPHGFETEQPFQNNKCIENFGNITFVDVLENIKNNTYPEYISCKSQAEDMLIYIKSFED